jgi:hypothetical protein
MRNRIATTVIAVEPPRGDRYKLRPSLRAQRS